jgi:hypothetical protein
MESVPDTTGPPAVARASSPFATSRVEVLRRPVEFTLTSAVVMEDHAVDVTSSSSDRHVHGVDNELGRHALAHGVPDDAPRTEVQDVGQI